MRGFPAVDVVIAAHNEEADLGACLKSVLGQRYAGSIHLYVVEHSSTDSTASIARQLGATVLLAKGSLGAARNLGISAGHSPLVAFLDAHCVASADWLLELVKCLQEAAAGGVQGQLTHLYKDSRLLSSRPTRGPAQGSAYPWLKTGNCLYLRQVLQEVGGFEERLLSCEDVDLSWRVLTRGYPLAYAPNALCTHLDRSTLWRHWWRFFRHGFGSGQIARRFSMDLAPRPQSGSGRDCWIYWMGARLGRAWPPTRLTRTAESAVERPFCSWSETRLVRPAPQILWWYDWGGLVVLAQGSKRCRLEGSGGLFWRCLTQGWTRVQVTTRVSKAAACPPERIAEDLDRWMADLVQEGWIQDATVRPESKTQPD